MVPLNKTLKFILSGEYIYNKGEDLEAVCHFNSQRFLLGQFLLLLGYLWGNIATPIGPSTTLKIFVMLTI